MRGRATILYLVVPCYNEEEVLKKTAEVLKKKILQLQENGKNRPNGLNEPESAVD